MIKKAAYPSHFNNLFAEFDGSLGGKGSKPKAYEAYRALKCTAEDSIMLISVLQRQKVEKMKLRVNGDFYPNFKSVELWLKHRRFEDERCESPSEQRINPADEALYAKYPDLRPQ